MRRNEPFSVITMQLVNNFLSSAVDEMMQVVVRTSLSPITREVFDFQCGYCRADGEMLLECRWRLRTACNWRKGRFF